MLELKVCVSLKGDFNLSGHLRSGTLTLLEIILRFDLSRNTSSLSVYPRKGVVVQFSATCWMPTEPGTVLKHDDHHMILLIGGV